MDILYADEEIERLCQDPRYAKRKLGGPSAKKLATRLDDLRAAGALAVMPKLPGRFHALDRDLEGCYALDLHGGRRLVLRPATDPLPRRSDDSIDLTQITAVTIEQIGDYHD
jgi:proteic killer suppression protein